MRKPRYQLLLTLLAASLALAGLANGESPEKSEQSLPAIERQLQEAQSNGERLAAGIAEALAAEEQISQQLVAISRKIQAAETAVSASESELARLSRERAQILARLGESQDILSELLAGLQRLEQNPPPALVVEPDNVLAALRGAMMFGTIVPELRDKAGALSRDLERLDQLQARIRSRKEAVANEIAALEASRADLSRLIARKKDLVAAGNTQLESERTRAADLAKKAKSLRQLLSDLAEERRKAGAERAKQAAAEEQLRRQKEAALRQPKLAFADAKGRLGYPAQGQILRRFGDDDGLGGAIQGTAIATRGEAQVTAPADGEVEFAGPFRSYGQVLILNPGGGYHILLAGMASITAQTGEFLRAGEPVGQMGAGPSSVTLLGDVVRDNRPVLYIEFRNISDAIDSGPWWIGGTKEARG